MRNKNKKITFYSPYGMHLQLFETELEIAESYIDRGYEVEFLTCNGILPTCEINPSKRIDYCLHCISRRNQGLKLLSKRVTQTNLLKFYKHDENILPLKLRYDSIDGLKNLRFGSFPLGAAVYSSLLDYTKDPFMDVNKYRDVIDGFIKSSLLNYISFKNYLKSNYPKQVYVFNGRHALTKPIIHLAKKNNVKFYTYEFSNYFFKYNLYENSQPHDFRYTFKMVHNIWSESKKEEKEKIAIARRFFTLNSSKISSNTYFHLSKQSKGKLPNNWDKKKENIVIFTSSEFENFAAFEYDEGGVYKDQFTGIMSLLNSLDNITHNFHIYIRLHPFLSTIDSNSKEIKLYKRLNQKYCTVIKPDDDIDSYAMIAECNKTVCFLSTISVEAAYMGKPSIILSNHFYSLFRFCYKPKNHEEFLSMLKNKNLKPLYSIDIYKVGFFMLNFGNKYKYYKPFKTEQGVFKRTLVKPHFFISNLNGYLIKYKAKSFKKIIEYLIYIFINRFWFNRLIS